MVGTSFNLQGFQFWTETGFGGNGIGTNPILKQRYVLKGIRGNPGRIWEKTGEESGWARVVL